VPFTIPCQGIVKWLSLVADNVSVSATNNEEITEFKGVTKCF